MRFWLILLSSYSLNLFAATLFVCQGNSARSYIAESISKKIFNHEAFSRGMHVESSTAESNAIEVLRELNINYPHQPQRIHKIDIINADLVLTMTYQQMQNLKNLFPKYSNKIFTLSQCANVELEDISDPYEMNLAIYRKVRDQIHLYEKIISSNGWQCR